MPGEKEIEYLVRRALIRIGSLAEDEAVSAPEYAHCKDVLRDMLEHEWQKHGRAFTSREEIIYALAIRLLPEYPLAEKPTYWTQDFGRCKCGSSLIRMYATEDRGEFFFCTNGTCDQFRLPLSVPRLPREVFTDRQAIREAMAINQAGAERQLREWLLEEPRTFSFREIAAMDDAQLLSEASKHPDFTERTLRLNREYEEILKGLLKT